jgi:hypothetical protein
VAAGLTNGSFATTFGANDMYIVRADRFSGNSQCAFALVNKVPRCTTFTAILADTAHGRANVACLVDATDTTNSNGRNICPPPPPGRIHSVAPEMNGTIAADRVPFGSNRSIGAFPTMHRMTLPTTGAITMLSSFPNPVITGAKVNVRMSQSTTGRVTIIVSDVVGRIVYRSERELPAGSSTLEISTHGWAGGEYIITLTKEDVSEARKLVVTES